MSTDVDTAPGGLSNFNATAFRSRSAWLVLDLALLVLAIRLVVVWVGPLYALRVFRPWATGWWIALLGVPALLFGSTSRPVRSGSSPTPGPRGASESSLEDPDSSDTPEARFRASAVPAKKGKGTELTVCADETYEPRTTRGTLDECLEKGAPPAP